MAGRLPLVDLTDLLVEVDRWTGFGGRLEHAAGAAPRKKDLRLHLYAAIIAQATNVGLVRMAELSDLSYEKLAWAAERYLREETLKGAVANVVDFHHRLPLSSFWGEGSFSSSDGQRFPVTVRARNAQALPRYFGRGRGVTLYSWVSDQYSQYGTKIIPATVREATYVLDEILDNETELPIELHSTDTSGFTELLFALFDLLGLQFAPRIRDIADQRLYRVDGIGRTPGQGAVASLLAGKVNTRRILERWNDLLRVAGSLKLGWVTASLLIGKLQAKPRKNALTRALQEHGKLVKSVFILSYLSNEPLRRRINEQLNKGEELGALRRFLFFANEGEMRRRLPEEQTDQALCLALATNAVIVWNTVYMEAAISQLRSEGYPVDDENLRHLSPTLYAHVNPYGRYHFDLKGVARMRALRPLRRPQRTDL